MNRIQAQRVGVRRLGRTVRIGAVMAALLLAVPVARADEIAQSLPTGQCNVRADFAGSGVLEVFDNGEGWLELSIDLTAGGDIRVNGGFVGSYSTLNGATVSVHIDNGDAIIEVRDAASGALRFTGTQSIGIAGVAVATGTAWSLQAE